MAGFLSGLSSVLQSPAVQQLLPTALGAAGGFLTTPRRAGFGGGLGNALLGAGAGMQQAQQMAYQQMLSKHYDLQDKIDQGNLDAQTQLISHFNQLSPADQQKYGNWQTYRDVMHDQLVANIDSQGMKQALINRLQTPEGAKALARMGITSPAQIMALPDDKESLKQYGAAAAPMTISEQTQADIEREKAKAEEAHQRVEEAQRGTELGIESRRAGIEGAEATARIGEARTEQAKTQEELNEATTWIDPKSMKVMAHGVVGPAGSVPLSDYKKQLVGKGDWIKSKTSGEFVHLMTGESPPETGGPWEPVTPAKADTTPKASHPATYFDPTDPSKTKNYDLSKGEAPPANWLPISKRPKAPSIENLRKDFEGGLPIGGKYVYPESEFKKYVMSRGIDPSTDDYLPAHASNGEGLPAGSRDNGDGSWSLPDGTKVWPK